jgi:N-methylhydantoinase A
VLEVANTKMVGALRAMSVQRGLDPRDFVLMPFGGAGSLHLCALIDLLGARGGFVPQTPGVMSAVGCVFADMQHELTRTLNRGLDRIGDSELDEGIAEHAARGAGFFGLPPDEVVLHPSLAMNYVGQTHTIDVPIQRGWTREQVTEAFEQAYRLRFGRTIGRGAVNVETLRTTLVAPRRFDGTPTVAADDVTVPAPERSLRYRGADLVARVLRRRDVTEPVAGPAVLVQADATILIEPGFTCRPVGSAGGLFVERES